ncbi:MAG TPA: gamma-glutamyltransferase [Myxococcota bacterium]|nr:gamma-glutamyltransferase [Myxococcota bacterium]
MPSPRSVTAVLAFVGLSLFAALPLGHAESPGPAWGTRGMVVTSVGPAVEAGREILGKGGNAVDAAIATAFAAGVAHQYSSGLGGGAFIVVHMAESGESAALDARETAPASAKTENYVDLDGKAIPDRSRIGPRAIAVPSLVQGLWELHQRYGSLDWKELLKPAIRLCRDGFEVGPNHVRMLQIIAPKLKDYPETARIQLDGGKIPAPGWRLRQPDLAKTLEQIAAGGGNTLARGALARQIADASGGALSVDDLASYHPIWRTPVRGQYRGLEIVSMPPPSSGGILLLEMLNALEPYDLAKLGLNSSEEINLVAGAMKLAFADRAVYLGDPDYWTVPTEKLISKEYGAELSAQLRTPPFFLRAPWKWGKAWIPPARAPLHAPPTDAGTTQISVVDGQGNAVSMTQTVNTLFGSLITVPGTGIVLNNEMDDFSITPNSPNAWNALGTEANAIRPGKRPLSSMTPTIVLENGQVKYVVGSPMGTFIITAVLQSLIAAIDFKLDPQAAVTVPRVHHQWMPDQLTVEPGHPKDVLDKLREWGHNVQPSPYPLGAVQLIARDPATGAWLGATDPRRDGAALGY